MTFSPPVHVLIDFIVQDSSLLDTPDRSMVFLRESVLAAGATVLSEHTHQFSPAGFSGILILAQSHASIHTWPESGLISIDIFACGSIDTEAALDVLRRRFLPSSECVEVCRRGALIPG